MKPLVLDKHLGIPKRRFEKSDKVNGYSKGISDDDKLRTKNANRSKIKGSRQQAKLEIKSIINELD